MAASERNKNGRFISCNIEGEREPGALKIKRPFNCLLWESEDIMPVLM